MSTENALLTILIEKINNDSLVLPTLPEVAIKVRRAADDPDINLNKITDVINQDPALSARVVKIANSAYLGRSVKVDTLAQAVTRIGLRQIKNIATALAMEQLFVSRNEIVSEYLNKSWAKTVEVAAGAIAIMQLYLKDNKRTSLNADTITLAALIHNIGILPILSEAERHPDVFANPTFLDSAFEKLGSRLGGAIMRAWGFTEEFEQVAEMWSDMNYDESSVGYVDFVRVAAGWRDAFGNERKSKAVVLDAVDMGILTDVSQLEDPEFVEGFETIKAAFS